MPDHIVLDRCFGTINQHFFTTGENKSWSNISKNSAICYGFPVIMKADYFFKNFF